MDGAFGPDGEALIEDGDEILIPAPRSSWPGVRTDGFQRAPSAWAPGLTMPRTVRDFTKSPSAVISHSPENCLIELGHQYACLRLGSARSKRTSSSPLAASISRQ